MPDKKKAKYKREAEIGQFSFINEKARDVDESLEKPDIDEFYKTKEGTVPLEIKQRDSKAAARTSIVTAFKKGKKKKFQNSQRIEDNTTESEGKLSTTVLVAETICIEKQETIANSDDNANAKLMQRDYDSKRGPLDDVDVVSSLEKKKLELEEKQCSNTVQNENMITESLKDTIVLGAEASLAAISLLSTTESIMDSTLDSNYVQSSFLRGGTSACAIFHAGGEAASKAADISVPTETDYFGFSWRRSHVANPDCTRVSDQSVSKSIVSVFADGNVRDDHKPATESTFIQNIENVEPAGSLIYSETSNENKVPNSQLISSNDGDAYSADNDIIDEKSSSATEPLIDFIDISSVQLPAGTSKNVNNNITNAEVPLLLDVPNELNENHEIKHTGRSSVVDGGIKSLECQNMQQLNAMKNDKMNSLGIECKTMIEDKNFIAVVNDENIKSVQEIKKIMKLNRTYDTQSFEGMVKGKTSDEIGSDLSVKNLESLQTANTFGENFEEKVTSATDGVIPTGILLVLDSNKSLITQDEEAQSTDISHDSHETQQINCTITDKPVDNYDNLVKEKVTGNSDSNKSLSLNDRMLHNSENKSLNVVTDLKVNQKPFIATPHVHDCIDRCTDALSETINVSENNDSSHCPDSVTEQQKLDDISEQTEDLISAEKVSLATLGDSINLITTEKVGTVDHRSCKAIFDTICNAEESMENFSECQLPKKEKKRKKAKKSVFENTPKASKADAVAGMRMEAPQQTKSVYESQGANIIANVNFRSCEQPPKRANEKAVFEMQRAEISHADFRACDKPIDVGNKTSIHEIQREANIKVDARASEPLMTSTSEKFVFEVVKCEKSTAHYRAGEKVVEDPDTKSVYELQRSSYQSADYSANSKAPEVINTASVFEASGTRNAGIKADYRAADTIYHRLPEKFQAEPALDSQTIQESDDRNISATNSAADNNEQVKSVFENQPSTSKAHTRWDVKSDDAILSQTSSIFENTPVESKTFVTWKTSVIPLQSKSVFETIPKPSVAHASQSKALTSSSECESDSEDDDESIIDSKEDQVLVNMVDHNPEIRVATNVTDVSQDNIDSLTKNQF